MNQRDIAGSVVAVLAIASSIAVWQLRSDDAIQEFTGPPRADYTLDNYQLVALDESGRAAFSAHGPLLVRDPYSHELSLQQPRLRIYQEDGGYWLTRADTGWVDSAGEQLRLTGSVVVDGHEANDARHLRLETELLRLFPKNDLIRTDQPVTITQANSILQGRGLEANLGQRQIRVLSEVKARYVTNSR
ncbi:MAG: LPS export ABC transporter periplasmic protein LptC [Xanthomonadaceae bacterium]|nr:LPS export ABC transporter periplasmic protein LptC [Xanthomonadaceae bacterium]